MAFAQNKKNEKKSLVFASANLTCHAKNLTK